MRIDKAEKQLLSLLFVALVFFMDEMWQNIRCCCMRYSQLAWHVHSWFKRLFINVERYFTTQESMNCFIGATMTETYYLDLYMKGIVDDFIKE